MTADTSTVQIYEWRAWTHFLAPSVFAGAARLHARLGESWRAVERRVSPGARFFLFHVNLTETGHTPHDRPRFLEHLARAGVRSLNAGVTDVRRRTIQACCRQLGLNSTTAAPDGPPDERLIVKTDRNCGGVMERFVSLPRLAALGMQPQHSALCGTRSYQIVPRAQIAPIAWIDPTLHIERYIANRLHRYYRVYVLGDRAVVSRVVNPAAIKKLDASMERRNFFVDLRQPVPDADLNAEVIRQVRDFVTGFQFEFGALDVVENDDGVPFIVDVNPTPNWGDRTQWKEPDGDSYGGILDHLRGGLLHESVVAP